MINFRKISIIFFSVGIMTTPSFALEDKVLEDIEALKDKNREMYYNGNGKKQ